MPVNGARSAVWEQGGPLNNKKLRLAVLFGGRSAEHEISIQSAASVLASIDRMKYDLLPVGISKEGRWIAGKKSDITVEQLSSVLRKGRTAPREGSSYSPLDRSEWINWKIDVVFPLLHGTFGEDGTIQGLLELTGIPYVGAGVLASAAGMDKNIMKRLFRDRGLPVAKWITVLRSEWHANPAKVRSLARREIGYPAFIKPANLGSSVGISKAVRARDLDRALNLAARYDRKILIEQAIDAREIECAVIGNDQPLASVPGEIKPMNEFYDYEAKYIRGDSKLLIPAPLTRIQTRRVQELATAAFQSIDCSGMARVDFLLDRKTGRPVVSEINTIPGFTSISMFPKLWEASGIPYPKLIDRLIELALERHEEKSQTDYSHGRR